MEIFNHNSKVNFLGLRKVSIGIAAFLMLASIVLIAVRGLNYAQDFTGGISVNVSYAEPVDTNAVRAALGKHNIENAIVQSLGGSRQMAIRVQPKDDPALVSGGSLSASAQADRVAEDVLAALKAEHPDVSVTSRSFVGPQVGAELR
ncbi:MAG: protein translocase subunit SecF, partial [Dyella sp.]